MEWHGDVGGMKRHSRFQVHTLQNLSMPGYKQLSLNYISNDVVGYFRPSQVDGKFYDRSFDVIMDF